MDGLRRGEGRGGLEYWADEWVLIWVVERTERLRATLEEEKGLLGGKRRERDWLVRCDEVAGRITARGATRAELDEWVGSYPSI